MPRYYSPNDKTKNNTTQQQFRDQNLALLVTVFQETLQTLIWRQMKSTSMTTHLRNLFTHRSRSHPRNGLPVWSGQNCCAFWTSAPPVQLLPQVVGRRVVHRSIRTIAPYLSNTENEVRMVVASNGQPRILNNTVQHNTRRSWFKNLENTSSQEQAWKNCDLLQMFSLMCANAQYH